MMIAFTRHFPFARLIRGALPRPPPPPELAVYCFVDRWPAQITNTGRDPIRVQLYASSQKGPLTLLLVASVGASRHGQDGTLRWVPSEDAWPMRWNGKDWVRVTIVAPVVVP